VLREYLLGLVHECSGRLGADLSAVAGADASGLTVLAAEVSELLSMTGLGPHFRVCRSVEAAISGAGTR
jgi:hypothetical protein